MVGGSLCVSEGETWGTIRFVGFWLFFVFVVVEKFSCKLSGGSQGRRGASQNYRSGVNRGIWSTGKL